MIIVCLLIFFNHHYYYLERIEYSDYNGRNRFIAIQSDQTAYPYGLAFFNGMLYWSDRANHSIFAANALNGTNKIIVKQATIHSAFALKIFHYSLQSTSNISNPFMVNNGGCSHLCLISVGGSSSKCACPDSYLLETDNKTCTANCSLWQFTCGVPEERCIPFFWKCDGIFKLYSH